MRRLYSFGIQCYAFGVKIAAHFNPKAAQMVEGWRCAFDQMKVSKVGNGKTAWFHASSLGEFEQARPVLEQFHETHPEYKICVTFFSPSGYEIRKNYPLADFVCYLPIDTRTNAIRFLNLMRPSVAFFAKYDFWFNYLEQLRRREVPTYIFSAIFRPDQYFFASYGKWFLNHLKQCFSHIFVQNEESLQLLKSHGVERVSIAGDTRFDRVHAIAQSAQPNAVVEQFLSHHSGMKVLLAGSSWEPDEENLKHYLDHDASVVLVLAPHVIEESHLTTIESLFGKQDCIRYSLIDKMRGDERVLIVDNMGLLSSMYRYAHIAYIGGGFGKGIHNILEAITFGKPVVFGPNHHKFKEALDIIRLGGGRNYSTYPELEQIFSTWLNDETKYQQAADACTQYMSENIGSTQKILTLVENELKKY